MCAGLPECRNHGDVRRGWLDDGRCVFCGLCAEACPTDALRLSNKFELAVRDRADLVATVRFGGEA